MKVSAYLRIVMYLIFNELSTFHEVRTLFMSNAKKNYKKELTISESTLKIR